MVRRLNRPEAESSKSSSTYRQRTPHSERRASFIIASSMLRPMRFDFQARTHWNLPRPASFIMRWKSGRRSDLPETALSE